MARQHHNWSHGPYAASRPDYQPASQPPSVRLPSVASLVSGPDPSGPLHQDVANHPAGREQEYYHHPMQQYAGSPPVQHYPPPYPAPAPRIDHYHHAQVAPAPPVHDLAHLPPTVTFPASGHPAGQQQAPREQPSNKHLQQRYAQVIMPTPDPNDPRPGKVAIPCTPETLRGAPTGRPKPPSPVGQYEVSPPRGMESIEVTSPVQHKMIAPQPQPSTPNDEFRVFVRQQPVAARSCGFGERDRRVIDPPPIVQLSINNDKLAEDDKMERLSYPYYVVHATIWSKDGQQDCTIMPEDYRLQRRLMGSLSASPFVGEDEHGVEGCFFCFSDLSCRTGGEYRLKFSLVKLDPNRGKIGKSYKVCATVLSDVFTVYNAKEFPGMEASSALAKSLKDQGCLISIKKGKERAGRGRGQDNYESSNDEDYDNPAPKRKRARRH